jgi:peptidyl-prolyl cis-trans isomerase C
VLKPEEVPAVVARIDGVDVTREDLLTRASEARGALAQRGVPPPQLTQGFLREVLNDVIGSRLLARDIQGKGGGATEPEIEAKIAEIRQGFPSDAEFDQALAGRGFDRARLRRDITESLTVNKWVASAVMPTVTVSEAEARAFYDANPDRMVEPEKVRGRHVLARVERDATAEAKAAQRAKIDGARARILAGADFAQVAKESSDDKTSAERGGDLGWFYRGQMVPAFEAAAFALPPKQLSEVVETPFGFHLIEVLEKQPAVKLTFEQVRPRIEGMLKQRQLEQKIKAQVNALAAQSKIEILL